ncbi:TonB-dependent siderophore receptor [Arenibaculum pallidiluteum]|uniref:TonB-dependent siderophore receptor n=1 Tax=Arenibaculum pallidiluteum TaxID=2812559 RepID=UPI001A957F53|nr:TonB-dependent receptor [Arenibaculum pallidiluteum]
MLPKLLATVSCTALFAACLASGAGPAAATPRGTGSAGPQQLAQRSDTRTFAIPAQPLAPALAAFTDQAGVALAYRTEGLAGLASPGVSGTMSPAEALQRLLAGTGVTFQFTGADSVTLARTPPGGDGSTLQLDPITIEGVAAAPATAAIGTTPPEYPGGQVARGARLGLLGNRDMMDTPFSTSSYTARTIEDRRAVTAADVLETDPAVRSSAAKGGILDAFFIRGFPIGEGNLGEIAFNGVYGVAPNYRVFPDYAERIEVLKGPSALLYGMAPNSSVGGTINIVPKRAPDTDLTRVTADYAPDSQFGGNVDLGRRFGEQREWGVRLNGSYHDGDTPLDKQSRKAFVGALAADYQGERLRATVDVLDQEERFDAPVRPFLVAPGIDVPSAPNGARNVTDSWAWSKVTDKAVLGQVEYDLTERMTLFAGAGGGRTTVDRLSGQTPTIVNARGDTTAAPFYFKFEIDRVTYDAGLRTSFDTGALGHTATFQASRYEDELSRGSTSSATTLRSNIYNPGDNAPVLLAEPRNVARISDSTLTGFTLADTLSALNERIQLTLGGRHQRIESRNFDATTGATTSSYDDDALTPVAGLVIKPWKDVSVYANYVEGLSRGDIAPSTASNAGQALAPYVATQHEVGVKVDFGRIAMTVAAFQIEKPFGQLEGGLFTEGGEQRNRGVEISAFGEVTDDLRLFGGVTFLDAAMTKTNSPATIGNRPIGVPEIQANLSVEWDTPFLEGLTLAGSAIHTGNQFVNVANTQSIPSWTRFDVGARYRTEVKGTPLTFRARVENVFDENYWSGVASSYGGLGLGAPRTAILSVSADF